jgi:hypothetical protein
VSQREALLRILSGQDTEPGATIFNVFASTLEKLHEPIFSKIDFEDIDGRTARLVVPGVIETRGEPIRNPVTGQDHRVRIDMIGGFEYKRKKMAFSGDDGCGVELDDWFKKLRQAEMQSSGTAPAKPPLTLDDLPTECRTVLTMGEISRTPISPQLVL